MGQSKLTNAWRTINYLLSRLIQNLNTDIPLGFTARSDEKSLLKSLSEFESSLHEFFTSNRISISVAHSMLSKWSDTIQELHESLPDLKQLHIRFPTYQNPDHGAYMDLFPAKNGAKIELYYSLIEFLSHLREMVLSNHDILARASKGSLSELSSYKKSENAFRYLGYDKNEAECKPLLDCFQAFQNEQLLSHKNQYSEFERVFTKKTPSRKLLWAGKKNLLGMFMKKLHDDGIIEMTPNLWQRTAACFSILKENGSIEEIDPHKIRKSAAEVAHKFRKPIQRIIEILQKGIGDPGESPRSPV